MARREDGWAERYAAFAVRCPLLLALVGLLVLGGSLPGAVHLYADLRTDLRELLPQGAPAAVALEELERRIGGFAQLAILVRTDDLQSGERFVDALAARLRALPPGMVRSVRADIREERAFVDAHGALYAPYQDLVTARDELKARIGKANPLAVQLDDDDPPAPASAQLDAALRKLSEGYDQVHRFPDGYLAGENGTTLVVLVSPPSSSASVDADRSLFDAIDREVRALDPHSFHPSLHVGYGGEVKEVLEAQEALVHDLLVSSVLVLLAVGVALLFYYRTPRALPLIVLPLFSGTALTFALSRLFIAHLNPNTAFLGSIIVGNGINSGIILLARYFEERRKGAELQAAVADALRFTWLPTLVAACAAAASYGSLCATGFRGFNQFGLMGAVGMLVCWVAIYAFMPPMTVLSERIKAGRTHEPRLGLAAAVGRQVTQRARPVAILCGLLAVVSAVAMVRFVRAPFQYDFSKLGSRRGEIDGASSWNRHLDAVLQVHQSPSVVLLDTPEQALLVSEALQAERAHNPSIDSVTSLQELLPRQQPEKIAVLRELLPLLKPNVIASLPERHRPAVEQLAKSTELREITLQDVPARLRDGFRERDGRTGLLVLVTPSLQNASSHAGKAQVEHARRVRAVAQQAVPAARVAGALILSADIVGSMVEDGALAAALSFAAVIALSILLLRSVRQAAWVIGSLCLGVLWLAGAMGALGLKLNFVNFVVLPITFGIGADYAVNLYLRYRQSGGGSPEGALAASGGAVALCSATTIIGYSALLVADNRAIYSFGLTAVLGEFACLTAALIALPAVLALRAGKS